MSVNMHGRDLLIIVISVLYQVQQKLVILSYVILFGIFHNNFKITVYIITKPTCYNNTQYRTDDCLTSL